MYIGWNSIVMIAYRAGCSRRIGPVNFSRAKTVLAYFMLEFLYSNLVWARVTLLVPPRSYQVELQLVKGYPTHS
jgi:hypothetical protein